MNPKNNAEGQVNEPQTPSNEELLEKISNLEEEKKNIVGEIQVDRKKRQELQDQISALQEALQNQLIKSKTESQPTEESKVAEVIKKILNEDKFAKAKDNKKIALDKFINENKEFDPANDIGGLKRTAFEKKLSRFNTDGLVEIEDFIEIMNDAKSILQREMNSSNSNQSNSYSSTSRSSSEPATREVSKLSPKDKTLMEQAGWSEDRYLKLKEKMPEYINTLLSRIS